LEAANVIMGKTYPLPIVDHANARLKTLMRYSVVKSKND
jgi:deoxyribodipyrimidine photo-lyase